MTEVAGEHGKFVVQAEAKTPLYHFRKGGWERDYYYFFMDRFGLAFRAELAAFFEALSRGEKLTPGVTDALESLRIPAIAKVWQAPWEVVSRQRGNGAVGLAYYLGQRHAGMTLRELGKCMGDVEYPAVSVAIARFQNRLKTERSLQRRVKQIEKLLKVEV